MAGLEVTIDSFPSAIIKDTMKIPIWDSDTQKTLSVLVSELRNIAATIEEGGTGKTASNENLKSVNKKIDDLITNIDNTFKTINENFTNIGNEIAANDTAIQSANENMTNHEGDADLHVTKEKQIKWDGYGTQLSEKTNIIFTGDDTDPLLQTKERFVCNHVNCPTNDYYFIQQFAYGVNKSLPITATSNRTLLAFGYRSNGSINKTAYFNNYFNGTWTGWQKIGNMTAISTALFSGAYTTVIGGVITLTNNITDQNKIFLSFGTGLNKIWNKYITCSDSYPNNFVLNEVITVTITDSSFVPKSVSFQVTAPNQLTVLDGSVNLRNIKGMV